MAFITLQQMYDAWKRVSDWVSGANTDQPNVQLSGRNVEEVIVANAVALTSTDTQTFNVDVSKYKKVQVFGFHSHDQEVTLNFFTKARATKVWDGTNFESSETEVKLATSDVLMYLFNTKVKFLDEWISNGGQGLFITVKPTIAPTSGSITIYLMGVPN
jgi:hypothetical protein